MAEVWLRKICAGRLWSEQQNSRSAASNSKNSLQKKIPKKEILSCNFGVFARHRSLLNRSPAILGRTSHILYLKITRRSGLSTPAKIYSRLFLTVRFCLWTINFCNLTLPLGQSIQLVQEKVHAQSAWKKLAPFLRYSWKRDFFFTCKCVGVRFSEFFENFVWLEFLELEAGIWEFCYSHWGLLAQIFAAATRS